MIGELEKALEQLNVARATFVRGHDHYAARERRTGDPSDLCVQKIMDRLIVAMAATARDLEILAAIACRRTDGREPRE